MTFYFSYYLLIPKLGPENFGILGTGLGPFGESLRGCHAIPSFPLIVALIGSGVTVLAFSMPNLSFSRLV